MAYDHQSVGADITLLDCEMVPHPLAAEELSGSAPPLATAEVAARGARLVMRFRGIEVVPGEAPQLMVRLQVAFQPPLAADFVCARLTVLLLAPETAQVNDVKPELKRVTRAATPENSKLTLKVDVPNSGGVILGRETQSTDGGGDAVVLRGVGGKRNASWDFYENPFTASGMETHYDLAFTASTAPRFELAISADARLRTRCGAGLLGLVDLVLPNRRFETALAIPLPTA